MAKMKVYELAQEMGLQSKDILTALKNKGIEVKSHMSVLEDGQVEDLKNSLKAPAKSEETPKAAEADKKEQPADAKAPGKKKKSIIFVSTPHNSKTCACTGSESGRASKSSSKTCRNIKGC